MAILILHDEEPADHIHDCCLWHNKPWPQWLMMEMSRTGFFSMRESALNIHFTDKKPGSITKFHRTGLLHGLLYFIHYEFFMFKTDSVTLLTVNDCINKPRPGFHCRGSDQRTRRGRW